MDVASNAHDVIQKLAWYAQTHALETKAEKKTQLLLRKKELLLTERKNLKAVERTVLTHLDKIDWSAIRPKLVVASSASYPLWVYLRMIVSSAPYTGRPGRAIRLFCMDETSNAPLGVLELGSDLQSLKLRDDWIGWSREEKYADGGLQRVANVSSCVPIQPFGILCGGKFMADALITDDPPSLAQKWRQKYGDTVGLLTITSLYGKSSMYNRIPSLEFLGVTEGLGVNQLSYRDYQILKEYALVLGQTGRMKNRTFLTSSRNDVLDVICAHLKIDRAAISTKTPKGVYLGKLVQNPRAVVSNHATPVPINRTQQDARDYYHARWYEMRYPKPEMQAQIAAFDLETYRVDAQIEMCDG